MEKEYRTFDTLDRKSAIRTTELKLTKEIKSLEVKLIKEIEAVRKETEAIRLEMKNLEVKLVGDNKSLEMKLIKEIEAIRLETKNLEVRLVGDHKNLEVNLTNAISENSKITIKWMIGLFITMIAAIIIPSIHKIGDYMPKQYVSTLFNRVGVG